jgi:hypothetical protein
MEGIVKERGVAVATLGVFTVVTDAGSGAVVAGKRRRVDTKEVKYGRTNLRC